MNQLLLYLILLTHQSLALGADGCARLLHGKSPIVDIPATGLSTIQAIKGTRGYIASGQTPSGMHFFSISENGLAKPYTLLTESTPKTGFSYFEGKLTQALISQKRLSDTDTGVELGVDLLTSSHHITRRFENLSPNLKYLVQADENRVLLVEPGKVSLWNYLDDTLEVITTPHQLMNYQVPLTPLSIDRDRILVEGNRIFNLKTKELTTIPLLGTPGYEVIERKASRDGAVILAGGQQNGQSIRVFHCRTAEWREFKVPAGMISWTRISGQDELLMILQDDAHHVHYQIIDPITQETHELKLDERYSEAVRGVGLEIDPHRTQGTADTLYFFTRTATGSETDQIIALDKKTWATTEYKLAWNGHPVSFKNDHVAFIQDGEKIRMIHLDAGDVATSGALPPENLVALKRYERIFTREDWADLKAKPDLYEVDRYFTTGGHKTHPEWALPYLLSVMKESDFTFMDFVGRFQLAEDSELLEKIASFHYDPALVSSWKGVVKKFLNTRRSLRSDRSFQRLSQWAFIKLLKPVLPRLDEEFKKDYTMFIARTISNNAPSVLRTTSQAKVLKFTHQEIRKWFGMPWREITDIDFFQEGEGVVRSAILGTQPIQVLSPGAFTTKSEILEYFGFYYQLSEPIKPVAAVAPGNTIQDLHVQWNHGDKKFTSHFVSKVLDESVESYSPQIKAPDYKKLWSEGSLSGALLIGDNMRASEKEIFGEYLSYYESEGFVFSKNKIQSTTNVQDYIGEKIQNGELHYLIKEAHADGDDNNLLRLVDHARVHVGEHKLAGGKVERIYLIENQWEKSPNSLLKNETFGTWIRNREKAGKSQFLYLNTSCGSAVKIAKEIRATHSATLVPIGGVSSMNTFFDGKTSVLRRVVDGLRKQESFEDIRQAIGKMEDNIAGYDRFVFPDDADFQKHIRSLIQLPTTDETTILGPDGRPFEIDNAPVIQGFAPNAKVY